MFEFEENTIDDILRLVRNEMIRARRLHGPFHSIHEAYGVLLEEVDELWDEIRANRLNDAKTEAIQVAASAARFLVDLERSHGK